MEGARCRPQWSYVKKRVWWLYSLPKDNGHQSISIPLVIGPEGNTIEIQIRTPDMHYNLEYGVAAHWRYKEGDKGFDEN